MAPYLAVLAAACTLMWIGYSTLPAGSGRRNITIFDAAAIATLAMFAGTRWMVGTDYRYYFRAYTSKLQPGHWWGSVVDTGQDVGFATLTYLARTSGIGFYTFSFAVSAATVAVTAAALWTLAERPRSTIALYVALSTYLVPLNAVRQGLAVGLVLLGCALAARGWRWRLLPLAAITATLHYSSLVAMLLLAGLFAASRAATPRARLAGLFAAAAVPAAAVGVSLASSILPGTLGRYLTYFGEGGAGLGSIISLGARAAIVAAALVILRRRALAGQPLLEVSAVTVGALFIASAFNSLVFARFDMYLFPFAALLLPRLVTGTERRRLAVGAALAILAVAYYVTYLTFWGGLLPYQTILAGPIRFGAP